MKRSTVIGMVALGLGAATIGTPVATAGTTHSWRSGAAAAVSGQPPAPGKIRTDALSSGGKAYFLGPNRDSGSNAPAGPTNTISLGSNVDANNPRQDLAAGQSETAIAAAGQRVLVGWNDATGFLVAPSTDRRASLTGVGYSADGGRTFQDLIGLPNDNRNQQWFGDPTIVAVDNGRHFIVGSLYLPSFNFDCSKRPAKLDLAVSVATVSSTGAVSFTKPIVTASGGDVCKLGQKNPPPNTAFLDKEWLGYDPASRTLAMSYTRFFFGFGGQSGTGQIEMVRAHVPADARTLTRSDFSRPITVWPEEQAFVFNQGSYVSLAPGGDAYISWERNLISNLFNGNPYVYIHAARVRRGDSSPVVGGPRSPRVVSQGQVNSSRDGGVKSLDGAAIAGYNRGLGNDFPRVAVDAALNKVIVVWNDASKHPLGDIWMRGLPMNLDISGPIEQVNDDNSYALHFLPAVSVRDNGSISTSWYDRRLTGPDSTRTDYFGEVRSAPTAGGADFRITTGSSDWNGTSSLIIPNFGDYTDNASTGNTTYYTWSDGRLGVPQPFVDSH